jgi:hypothetical protein
MCSQGRCFFTYFPAKISLAWPMRRMMCKRLPAQSAL